MKTSKRILSSVLAILMVLSVWSVSFTATAVQSNGSILEEVVLETVARPKVKFYCTEITRVAKAVNSTEPGTTIVKATPSGVPELSGPYASQAYAGETPAATKIIFQSTTVGVTPISLTCNNSSIVFSDMVYDGSTGTYTVEIISGTAEAGKEPLVFTMDYSWTDGNSYQEKCVSYVESIVTGGAFAYVEATFMPYSGTNSYYRSSVSAITRLLGKGVYYEQATNVASPATYGSYNVATGTYNANVASGYNTSIYTSYKDVEANGATKDITHTPFVIGTPTAHVYVDSSSAETLADINLRLDASTQELSNRNNDNPYTSVADIYVMSGSYTSQPSSYTNDAGAAAILGYTIPAKADYGVKQQKKNTALQTVTAGVAKYSKIFTKGFTGKVADIVDGSSYTIINKYYSYLYATNGILIKGNITTAAYTPTAITFHIVDKSALRELIDYVMNSDPDSPKVANNKKGVNPQAWYYRTGFSKFQEAYVAALATLNNPKATQDIIDADVKSLRGAYNSLTLKTADYTEVTALNDIADEILDNAAAYSPEAVALVEEAQDCVVDNYNILYQDSVDTMAENLRTAINNAVPLMADYTKVYVALAKADMFNSEDYENWNAVEEAINAVVYNLIATRQADVDAMAKAIEDALANLKIYTADTDALTAKLEEAKTIDQSLYINGSALKQAISKVDEALASMPEPIPENMQDDIDELTKVLEDAMDALVMKSADKSPLEAALSLELTKEESAYNQELLDEYKALVNEGLAMYAEDLKITANDSIKEKAAAITAAYEAVEASAQPEVEVDTSALEDILKNAYKVDLDNYEVDDAMAEFLDAVADAEDLLVNASEGDEQAIADAVERIENAILGLNEKKPDFSKLYDIIRNANNKLDETVEVVTYINGELDSEEKAKYDEDAILNIIDEITNCISHIESGNPTIDVVGWIDEIAKEAQAELDALKELTYPEYLNTAITEYEETDSSLYTETSWDAYEAAYNAAALEDAAQADINEALINLVNAKENLTLAESASFDAAADSTTVVNKEAGIIYGLTDEGISDLEEFVEYTGGVIEYEESVNGFGTGTVVNFVVNGEVSESYVIIIFGDITGDGVVDTFDYATLAAIINGDIEAEEGSALYTAADVYADGAVDTFDLAVLSAYIVGNTEISQIPDLI